MVRFHSKELPLFPISEGFAGRPWEAAEGRFCARRRGPWVSRASRNLRDVACLAAKAWAEAVSPASLAVELSWAVSAGFVFAAAAAFGAGRGRPARRPDADDGEACAESTCAECLAAVRASARPRAERMASSDKQRKIGPGLMERLRFRLISPPGAYPEARGRLGCLRECADETASESAPGIPFGLRAPIGVSGKDGRGGPGSAKSQGPRDVRRPWR